MLHSETVKHIDWVAVGWAVYAEDVREADFFPAVHDAEAQRRWLAGFRLAWIAAHDDGASVNEALDRALDGREALLQQLRCQRLAWEVVGYSRAARDVRVPSEEALT